MKKKRKRENAPQYHHHDRVEHEDDLRSADTGTTASAPKRSGRDGRPEPVWGTLQERPLKLPDLKKTSVMLTIAVGVIVFSKMYVVETWRVTGASMEPTLPDGSLVLVNIVSFEVRGWDGAKDPGTRVFRMTTLCRSQQKCLIFVHGDCSQGISGWQAGERGKDAVQSNLCLWHPYMDRNMAETAIFVL